MKTIVQNSDVKNEKDAGKNEKKHEKGRLIETLLIRSCIAALLLLVVSQTVLTIPSVRTAFFNEGTDGEPLGREVYSYKPCRLELSLVNMDECPELAILVNGEAAETFQGKSVLLDLKDGDVVELDATEVLVPPVIQISAVSRNIEAILGKKIEATGGIVPVATLKTGN